jgi:hypothetical protein
MDSLEHDPPRQFQRVQKRKGKRIWRSAAKRSLRPDV